MIKLGGAVITEKEREKCAKREVIRKIMEEISGKAVGIVHGGGSFGHPLAKKVRMNEKRVNVKEALEVMKAMDMLSSIVLSEAERAGIDGALLRPRDFVVNKEARIYEAYWKIFSAYHSSGAVPITHGDVVPDLTLGFSVCSGDDLMVGMCKELRPDLAIFLTDVPGIYERDPKEDPRAKMFEEISSSKLKELKISPSWKDATGGMARKVEAILKIAEICPVYVLKGDDVDNLRRAISGRDFFGTKVFKDREEEVRTPRTWDLRRYLV